VYPSKQLHSAVLRLQRPRLEHSAFSRKSDLGARRVTVQVGSRVFVNLGCTPLSHETSERTSRSACLPELRASVNLISKVTVYFLA